MAARGGLNAAKSGPNVAKGSRNAAKRGLIGEMDASARGLESLQIAYPFHGAFVLEIRWILERRLQSEEEDEEDPTQPRNPPQSPGRQSQGCGGRQHSPVHESPGLLEQPHLSRDGLRHLLVPLLKRLAFTPPPDRRTASPGALPRQALTHAGAPREALRSTLGPRVSSAEIVGHLLSNRISGFRRARWR
jgi:hypothetical protein